MKYLLVFLLLGFAVAPLQAQAPADLKSFHRILIVGDSITHSVPGPAIGWTGDWGMGATAQDKDYVHLFLAKLAAAQGPGAPAPDVWICAQGGGKITDKLPLADKIAAFHADLALIQLGENDAKNVTVEGFQKPYEKLLTAIRAGNPNARILCVGVWGIWPTGDQTKDVMIRAACAKYGATYADLGAAYTDPANRTLSEHRYTNTAVNWHPSDAGMIAYANAFWQALSSPAPTPLNPPPE
jgi:lysophospholipase L1-like esterase